MTIIIKQTKNNKTTENNVIYNYNNSWIQAHATLNFRFFSMILNIAGADPGFQVRGGGALKKITPSGGRCENCWGIMCEKSLFYAKKSYFFQLRGRRETFWGISYEKSLFYAKKSYIFQLRREARNIFGYFVWKITILRQ